MVSCSHRPIRQFRRALAKGIQVNLSPAINLFIAALVGAYMGIFFKCPLSVWIVLTILLASIALISKNLILRALSVFLFVLFVVSGLANVQLSRHLKQLPKNEATFEGTITNLSPSLENKIRADFKVTGVLVDNTRKAIALDLILTLREAATQIEVCEGDRIRVKGRVKPFRHALSPGEFDPYWYGLARSLDGTISVSKALDLVIVEREVEPSIFSTWRSILRKRLLEITTPREAAVLLALIIGDIRLFDEEQTQIYRDVGAGHLLAVSGLQVSLLAFVFFRLFHYLLLMTPRVGRLSRARPIAAVLALIAIGLFTALCGAPPSAVRAAGMASMMLAGIIFAYPIKMSDAFGLTGFLTILFSPASVVDPSFLLSYSAVLGLILASGNFITSLLAPGLLTLPISAYLFGSFSVGGLIANIILIPSAVVLQTPAIFLAVVGAWFKNSLLIDIAAGMAGYLEAICDAMGSVFGYVVTLTSPNALATAILFAAMLCLMKRQFIVAAFLVVISIAPTWIHPRGVRITLLPVGQGDSTVFELPTGHVMLVDGGADSRVIEVFLKRRWIKRIDVMVVTHPHLDHILGLLEIASDIEIGEIWHSGFPSDDVLLSQLLSIAQRRKIIVKFGEMIFGKHYYGNVMLDVIGPHPIHQDWSANNNSLVMRVQLGKDSALWPGDAEQIAEADLLAHVGNLKSTIVKAGHHGSKTSSSLKWVLATNPEHVIFCTKEDNQWGFPNADVVRRWQKQGAQIWNTGTNGEVTIWLTGNGVSVNSFATGAI